MRRRYHIHLPGLLFVGVTALLGIGAINSQNNLLFLVFGLCLGTMIVSGILSGSMMMGLHIRRLAVPEATVGETLRIPYLIQSRARHLAAHAILIRERPEGITAQTCDIGTTCVIKVGPGERIRTHALAIPSRRGRLRLARFEASSSFPFGIFRKSISVRQTADIIVFPRTYAVRQEVFLSTTSTRFSQTSPVTNRRGLSNEFWGLREYVPGDSARLIAWRSAARTGELVVRQHTETPVARIRVLLVFSSRRTSDEHERIIEAGASVIRAAIRRNIPCALTIPQASIHTQTGITPVHQHTLLRALAELPDIGILAERPVVMPPEEDVGLIILTNNPAIRQSARSIVITLDQLDERLYINRSGHADANTPVSPEVAEMSA